MDPALSTPRRLLRILIGGAILATAWVAFDLVTHSESASASEVIDVPSIGSGVVPEVVIPLVAPLVSIAAPVEAIVAPPLAVIAPIVEPLLEPVVEPVVEAIVAPVVAGVVSALPALPLLPGASLVLPAAGLVRDTDTALSPTPLRPLPVGGSPRDLPPVPTTTDTAAGTAAVLYALALAPPGSTLSAHPGTAASPSSPTYGFDTTPD